MNTPQVEREANGTYCLSGALVFATVPSLYERFTAELQHADEIIVDLEQVTRADSAGLALLVEWQRVAHNRRAKLRFINIPSQLQAMIRVTGLQDAFSEGANR